MGVDRRVKSSQHVRLALQGERDPPAADGRLDRAQPPPVGEPAVGVERGLEQAHAEDPATSATSRDGHTRARRGSASAPAFTLTTDVVGLLALVTGARQPRIGELRGDYDAYDRFVAAHALPSPL